MRRDVLGSRAFRLSKPSGFLSLRAFYSFPFTQAETVHGTRADHTCRVGHQNCWPQPALPRTGWTQMFKTRHPRTASVLPASCMHEVSVTPARARGAHKSIKTLHTSARLNARADAVGNPA